MAMGVDGYLSAANDALQATAIVIGGSFAYVKYVRGRIHYVSLALTLTAEAVDVNQRRSLIIATKITNSGTYRIIFKFEGKQQLSVYCLDKQKWATECHGPRLPWLGSKPIEWDQLVDDEGYRDITVELEPGESSSASWVVPLPPGEWSAYRVVFSVDAQSKMLGRTSEPWTWETSTIVTEK